MPTVSITQLEPSLADAGEKDIKAVVTLLWPYSSSTRKAALLLADPDFRLRNRKGQVRVQLAGPAAQAVARSKIAIGDEVTLSLEGASWVDATPGLFTPGKSVDAELLFKGHLVMWIRREGSEIATLNVDEPDASASPTRSPAAVNGFTTPRVASLHNLSDTPVSAYSPAFHKRARVSEGSFVDSPIDPFADNSTHPEERDKKRQRLSWGLGARWRLADREASPLKRYGYEYWLEEDNIIRKGSEAVEISQSRELIPEETTRIPDASVDSTLPPTRAPIGYQVSHDELPWHDERGKFASQFSQQLAQELGGDTEDEEEHTEKSPQLESPSKPSQLTESQVEVTVKLSEAVSERRSEMPPPALPTLQTSQVAFQQHSRLMAPPSASPRSPRTPELHPLQSAALPVPSPFPGDQLETSSFFPVPPRDFTTPSRQSQIGIVPDYMFQFGFGLDGSALPTARLGGPVEGDIDFQELDHAVTDRQREDPKSSPPTALMMPAEELEVLDGDSGAPGPGFTAGHVHAEAEEAEEVQERSDEVVVEKSEEARAQLSPQGQETLQFSPKAEPVVIELLSDSESEVSTEEEETGDEGMADTEEEVRSPSLGESELESSESREIYQDYDEDYEEEEDDDDEGEEENNRDGLEGESEYKASRIDEHAPVTDGPSQRILLGDQLHQESENFPPINEESASESAADRNIPPGSSLHETVIIDLSSDSSRAGNDTRDTHIAVHSSPQWEIQDVHPVQQTQIRKRLHSSQGQTVYPYSSRPVRSQSSTRSQHSKLVIEGTEGEDASISTQPPPAQIRQPDEVSEPEDHDIGGMTPKPSSSGDVMYPQLPLHINPYVGVEQRSPPQDRVQSQEDQEASSDVSIWDKRSSSPFPTQIAIQETTSEIPQQHLEDMPEKQPAFEAEAWHRFPSSPPISPPPAQSESALFFGVDLSPELSQAVSPTFPPTQQPAQQHSISTATTSLVPDSLLPSQQGGEFEEERLERHSSPAPEMEQVTQEHAIPSALSQIFASQINQSQESPSTLGKYATAKDQESFTLRPETQFQAQESFTLKPETFDSQQSVSNDVRPGTQQNGTVPSPKSQSKQSEKGEILTNISIGASEPPSSQFNKGLRTPLSYFHPLSSLRPYVNSSSQFDSELDVLAVVSHKSSDPKRAEKGPRDWYTQFNIVDASLPPLDGNTKGVRVQCFRRNKNTLPKAEVGDVILLRAFEVISAKGGLGVGLRSGESSAWCVWRFDQSQEAAEGRHRPLWTQKAAAFKKLVEREEVKGPPVETGLEEREEVWRLKAWWESVGSGGDLDENEKEEETPKYEV